MPILNLRLARPALLIDVNGLAEIAGIRETAEGIVIGALTRHADIIASELVQRRLPLLAQAGRHIAHVAIRSRGTIGGSLCLADPAAEWPACALALGAEMELVSRSSGTRKVPADAYFQGLYTTARRPDELLARVVFPRADAGRIAAFDEIARRHGDFAMAGLALTADGITPRVAGLRIAMLGVADRPVLATRAMAALEGGTPDEARIPAVVEALRHEIDPPDDPACPAAYRRHVAGVLLARVLRRLIEETQHGV